MHYGHYFFDNLTHNLYSGFYEGHCFRHFLISNDLDYFLNYLGYDDEFFLFDNFFYYFFDGDFNCLEDLFFGFYVARYLSYHLYFLYLFLDDDLIFLNYDGLLHLHYLLFNNLSGLEMSFLSHFNLHPLLQLWH